MIAQQQALSDEGEGDDGDEDEEGDDDEEAAEGEDQEDDEDEGTSSLDAHISFINSRLLFFFRRIFTNRLFDCTEENVDKEEEAIPVK